ncbi:MAG: hypothetical protein AMJ53_03070 [Gammaproteobacteria bacterium SG8_11]|nr:MAG: hypothetical protein AMJ53_03070 [Gammaproteobacteria bacterium SG8_11]
MTPLQRLEHRFKWIFLCCLFVALVCYFYKDKLPAPAFYDSYYLIDPIQTPTTAAPFTTQVNDQHYFIEPLYDYELNGAVVSYHDADAIRDIWHHDKWLDFINLRDLCVIWGDNVTSGVYLDMDFSNDSWTCWAYWPDRATGQRFNKAQLSNNHLLVNDPAVKQALMSAEPGDQIRLKGMLASYRNPGNNFFRGTSITRSDTGNGACETIYVSEFEIIKKANSRLRAFYDAAKWLTVFAFIGFAVLFAAASPLKH